MNTLKSNLVQNIHEQAVEIVKRYKRAEVELIEILEQADTLKVHYALGYNSLFKYATDGLGLSSEVAYIYINVSRKAKEVPALKKEIQSGAITVSKAKKISSVINPSNQKHWLQLAKTCSKRELEKQVASLSPKEVIRDKMNYIPLTQEIKEQVKIVTLPELSDEAIKGTKAHG